MPDAMRNFFVSYTHKDLGWAERIVSWLHGAGYSVIAQYKDFAPGVNWVASMETALRSSERTIAVLSQDYLASEYCNREWQASVLADVDGSRRKLIPVRISQVDFGGSMLAQWNYVDLVGLAPEDAEERFVAAVEAALAGRGLPPPMSPLHLPREPRILPAGPERNAGFVGRDEILRSLRDGFFDGSGEPFPSARQILCGMSGTGKTEIAVEYAHRNAGSYETALFVRGGSREAVSSSYVGLAATLGLYGHADIGRVRDALDRTDRLLLIVDDVEDEHVEGLLPRRGHVLVTTRSPMWPDTKNLLTVGAFDRQESIKMIVDRLPASGIQDADGLAADLGDLPVALTHLLRNAQGTGRSVAKLREVLARDPGLVTRGAYGRSRPADEFWQNEIAALAGREPAAACLLRMAALLAPDWDIPHALFEANPAVLPGEMGAETGADAGIGIPWLDQAIVPAVSSSWFIRTPPDRFAMHKVVALSVQQSTPTADRHRFRRSLLLLLHEAGLGSNAAIGHSPEVWTWWSEMLHHVLTLLDHPETAEAIAAGERLADRADLARKVADLADRSATFLSVIGAWGEAVRLHRRALAILALLDGPDSVAAAEVLRNLAGALLACGAAEAAVSAAERAVAIDTQHYEPTDSVIATDHRMLACALLDADDVEGAAVHAVRSLEVLTGLDFGGARVAAGDAGDTGDTSDVGDVGDASDVGDTGDASDTSDVGEKAVIDMAMIDIASTSVENLARPGVRADAVSDSLGLLGDIAHRRGQAASAIMLLEAATRLDGSRREGRLPRPAEADRLFQLADLAEEQGDTTKAAISNAAAKRLAEEIFGREGRIPIHDLHLRRAMLSIPTQGEPT